MNHIVPVPDATVFKYDCFVKDHLGNTRMVLSEEEQLDAYPAATMELSQASVETALYSNVEETRSAKPAGYPADTYTDPNNYVAKLNGNGNKVGPGIVLKVMSGDRVNIRASSWYYLNGADPGTPVNPLNDLLNVLATGVSTVVTDFGKFTRTDLISNGILSPGVGSMLDQQTASYSNSTKPKAYLSWILLDEQFRLVSSSSGFEQVGADGELKTWVKTNLPINRNGYLYVYTSNESPVDVFFDNLQVSHTRGPLLEETHYYPFGLTMAGISSKAAGKLENKNKFNGNKLESKELSDGSGLEAYDANFRQRDAQTGRWWQLDPMMEAHPDISPYAFVNNNPILYADPLGLDTIRVQGEGAHKIKIAKGDVLEMTIRNTTSYYTYDPDNKDAVNGFVGSGVAQDDSRGGESSVTVTSDKKASGTDYSGLSMAGLGMGIEYAGGKMFSKAAQTWFDPKQWKTYGQRFYGNQYTIRQATARRAALGFKYLGYGIGLLQESGIVFNNELSTRDKITDRVLTFIPLLVECMEPLGG